MITLNAKKPKIVVVGSCSIDLVLSTTSYPFPNHTVLAHKTERFFGGKGANQAFGTARLGADVALISCVGKDFEGQQIIENLRQENVNIKHVLETEKFSTGKAYVIATHGENTIVVDPAANSFLNTKHIDEAEYLFQEADLILIQLEIPMEVVEYTFQLCKKLNKKIGIYAAPATKISDFIVDNADFIVLKSDGLSIIFENGRIEEVLKKYPNKLFIRDRNSTTYFNGTEMKYYRNDHEEGVNAIGMGDAFTSGFAVAFCHQNSIEDCVKFGNEISLKVAKVRGSQLGLPRLQDFE